MRKKTTNYTPLICATALIVGLMSCSYSLSNKDYYDTKEGVCELAGVAAIDAHFYKSDGTPIEVATELIMQDLKPKTKDHSIIIKESVLFGYNSRQDAFDTRDAIKKKCPIVFTLELSKLFPK